MTFNNQSFFSIALFRKLAEARPDCFSDLTSDVVRTFWEFLLEKKPQDCLPKESLLYSRSIVLFQISNQFVLYIKYWISLNSYFTSLGHFLLQTRFYVWCISFFYVLARVDMRSFIWFSAYLVKMVLRFFYASSVSLREKFILWLKEEENKSNRLDHKKEISN